MNNKRFQDLFEENCGLITTVYDPARVAARLGLSMGRMPLLASLLNTDYISRRQLWGLQSMVGGGDGRDKSGLIYNLAAWIRRTEKQVGRGSYDKRYEEECVAGDDEESKKDNLIIQSLVQAILSSLSSFTLPVVVTVR